MPLKIIPVTEFKEGDILAETIMTDNSATPLIVENTVLNTYIANKLSKMNIQQVRIYRQEKKTASTAIKYTFEEFETNYIKKVNSIKELLTGLVNGQPLNLQKVDQITDSIFDDINLQDHIIRCLSEVKNLDIYTYQHAINVSFYAMLLAKWLNMSESEIKLVIQSGLLHDIGKSQVPTHILNKPGKLSDHEYAIMKNHSYYGFKLLQSENELDISVKKAVLMHHEREDQSGYPAGISGTEIHPFAKIIAICDVYDAMTSNRVYKTKSTPFDVFDMFLSSGLICFDTSFAWTFLNHISSYYIGTKVVLNTGDEGEIVFIPPHQITEPIVRLDSGLFSITKQQSLKIAYCC